MIDVIAQINAVRRTVGTRVLEAGEARAVTISRVYDTTVEDLWDACTSAERIPRWFLPVSGDLRPGGRFQLEGNAGGAVERCDPPKSFAITWEFGEQASLVEVRLTEEPSGGTRFELEHTVPVDDHWTEFGPGAVGLGWELGLLGLSLHVPARAGGDPAEAAAWAASEEGRSFVRLSSDGWCDADVASGTEQDLARAAADRTTAAYTSGS